MYRKNQDEPVVLTLSSDEEDCEDSDHMKLNNFNHTPLEINPASYEPVNPKEPIIEPNKTYEEWQLYHQNYKLERERIDDDFLQKRTIKLSLQCSSVRIGSYKVCPNEKFDFSVQEIVVRVPPVAEGDGKTIALTFPIQKIRKILAHLGPSLPVLFIYVTDGLARSIRQELQMVDQNAFYFDPCSFEESQKRLTIVPEHMQDENKKIIRNMFKFVLRNELIQKEEPILEEISQKDANEILIRSSAVEIEPVAIARAQVAYETKTLLVFPPPPNRGGITITMDDFCCLKEEQFLNDVMVDFFLKWLHTCRLEDSDRERTHVFSTFFYKRLTTKPKYRTNSEIDSKLSAAERRHARVQSWTKNVDIFSKDFILIPINEQCHWFLAVICFPYLDGPIQSSTGKLVPVSEVTLPTRSSSRKKKKVEIPVIDDDDDDRDEAEGDDFELEDDDDVEEETDSTNAKDKKQSDDSIKQSCILILDSLTGSSRGRIVTTLREYLTIEFSKRKKKTKIFNKCTMVGASPKVPQQMNFSDCGIFTLQYAESFFKTPLQDFRLPIRSLQNWFDQDVASGKREAIADLIKSLMDEFKPDHGMTLPSVHDPPDYPEVQGNKEHSALEDSKLSCLRSYSSSPKHSTIKNSPIHSDSYLYNSPNELATSKINSNSNSSKTGDSSNNSHDSEKNPPSAKISLEPPSAKKPLEPPSAKISLEPPSAKKPLEPPSAKKPLEINSPIRNMEVNNQNSKSANKRALPISAPLRNFVSKNNEENNQYSKSNNLSNIAEIKNPNNKSLKLLCDYDTGDDDDEFDDVDDENSVFITNRSKRYKSSHLES